MTDLHFALLAIALIVIAGLFIYGKLQERRAARRIDTAMRSGVGDPLQEAAGGTAAEPTRRIEPRLGESFEPAGEDPHSDAVILPSAPSAHVATLPPERKEPSAYGLADGWVEDPMLDFVLELRCSHPVDGVAAIEARGLLERLDLPLPTHLAVWDARAQRWSSPDRFGFYSEVLAAVQMATRRHCLGEIESSRFAAAVQQVAVQLEADFDPPDIARLVTRASELDRTCARFDVQITLTLEPNETPWTAHSIEDVALDVGFERRDAQRWERGPRASPVLIMTGTGTPIQRLTLQFDVPLVPVDTAPLAMLFTSADQLAGRLNARIVDDNARPIQSGAQVAIESQLSAMHTDMRNSDIEPGSTRARRLFAA